LENWHQDARGKKGVHVHVRMGIVKLRRRVIFFGTNLPTCEAPGWKTAQKRA
jgi:hypothetical protein